MFARGSRRNSTRPPLTDTQLFESAVRALATRSRSEVELRRLLSRKIEPPIGDRIDKVIARLHELGYLSDVRLAENFVECRQKQGHLGSRRVAQELRRRGVSADVVEDTVERAYSEVDELQLAQAFAEKKRLFRAKSGSTQAPLKDPKETARVLRALTRAGFSLGTCWKVVRMMADSSGLAGIEEAAADETGESASDG